LTLVLTVAADAVVTLTVVIAPAATRAVAPATSARRRRLPVRLSWIIAGAPLWSR
jgi:hypothetical protein